MSIPYMIPKTLIDSIRENRCLPVIGAGFSLNAKLSDGKTMSTWMDLTKILAEKIQTTEKDPLLVSQEFQNKTDRTTLIQTIENLLHKDEAKPQHVHRHFVKIPYFDIICTTNYDNLLEDAYKQESKLVKVIVEKQQISLHGSSKELKILKLHGDLDHTHELIITKNNYDRLKAVNPNLDEKKANTLIQIIDLNAKSSFVSMCGFQLEAILKQIAKAHDIKMNGSSMRSKFQSVLKYFEISSEDKLNLIDVFYWTRNTLHNRGIVDRPDETSYKGHTYEFEVGKEMKHATWDYFTYFVSEIIGLFEEILNSKKYKI